MKLEDLLGKDLYSQVQAKIDEANAGQEDKLKHIRYADLSEGGYVSKEKYGDLETDLSNQKTELEKANGLIAELKKSNGDNSTLQQKIKEYETEIANLQAENAALKVDNALKFELVKAGAVDVDYLIYKAKEKDNDIKLNDDGTVKGISDLIAGLKTQLPTMFAGGDGKNNRKVLENNLPKNDGDKTVTKEQFKAMGYDERLKLKKDNPELFEQLSKN